MHTFKRILALVLLVSTFASSCKKSIDNPPPAPAGVIALVSGVGTIAANTIDSVEVYLSAATQPIQRFKMEAVNGYWQFKVPTMPQGQYAAEIRVYQKKANANDQVAYQYSVQDVVTLPLQQDIFAAAPTGQLTDPNWRKRLMMHDPAIKTTFIMGLKFTDPFFELRVGAGMEWKYVYVDKIAHQRQGSTNQQVGSAAFEIFDPLVAPGLLNNTTAFGPLAVEMVNKQWNNGEILLLMLDAAGEEYTFYHTYEK